MPRKAIKAKDAAKIIRKLRKENPKLHRLKIVDLVKKELG